MRVSGSLLFAQLVYVQLQPILAASITVYTTNRKKVIKVVGTKQFWELVFCLAPL